METTEVRNPSIPQPSRADEHWLLDRLLERQRDLSAVERFARAHDAHARRSGDGQAASADEEPLQSRYYRDLIPATAPAPGQQYSFEVDLDACTGCKACVAACHNLNGLAAGESWRDVGELRDDGDAWLQTVTTACHHCLDPACASGCPVGAYEKDAVTGIVRHLDDQCIGCKYCMLKCPYDVPKYNEALGIVRKCDMCSGRLAAGEAPACVQACPNQAIRIRTVDVAATRTEAADLLPGAAPADYTLPTTRYRTRRSIPANARAADAAQLRPAEEHLPLAVMLVATQMSVGTLAVACLLAALAEPPAQVGTVGGSSALADVATPGVFALSVAVAAVAAVAGIAASTAHLGRPLYAFRALLGLRTSWLSREILAFGIYAPLVAGLAALPVLESLAVQAPNGFAPLLSAAALAAGAAAVATSVMIYHDTRRPLWHARSTAPRFALTGLTLGSAVVLAVVLATSPEMSAVASAANAVAADASATARGWGSATGPSLVLLLGLATALLAATKAALDLSALRGRHEAPASAVNRAARLLVGPLRSQGIGRMVLAATGIVLAALAGMGSSALLAVAAVLALAAGEFLERRLFFRAGVAPGMPGALR